MNRQFKVLWTQDGRRLFKVCEDVATAKEFRRKLYERGVEKGKVYLVSRAKAYGPQKHSGSRPSRNHLWCPYCVAWRVFQLMSYVSKEFPTPSEETRCTVCSMPITNYYVQYYNQLNTNELRSYQRMASE